MTTVIAATSSTASSPDTPASVDRAAATAASAELGPVRSGARSRTARRGSRRRPPRTGRAGSARRRCLRIRATSARRARRPRGRRSGRRAASALIPGRPVEDREEATEARRRSPSGGRHRSVRSCPGGVACGVGSERPFEGIRVADPTGRIRRSSSPRLREGAPRRRDPAGRAAAWRPECGEGKGERLFLRPRPATSTSHPGLGLVLGEGDLGAVRENRRFMTSCRRPPLPGRGTRRGPRRVPFRHPRPARWCRRARSTGRPPTHLDLEDGLATALDPDVGAVVHEVGVAAPRRLPSNREPFPDLGGKRPGNKPPDLGRVDDRTDASTSVRPRSLVGRRSSSVGDRDASVFDRSFVGGMVRASRSAYVRRTLRTPRRRCRRLRGTRGSRPRPRFERGRAPGRHRRPPRTWRGAWSHLIDVR